MLGIDVIDLHVDSFLMRVGGEMSRQLGTGRPVKKRSALQGGPNKMYPDTRVGMEGHASGWEGSVRKGKARNR